MQDPSTLLRPSAGNGFLVSGPHYRRCLRDHWFARHRVRRDRSLSRVAHLGCWKIGLQSQDHPWFIEVAHKKSPPEWVSLACCRFIGQAAGQVDPIQPQGNDKPEKNGSPFHKAGRSFAFYRRYENAARPEGSGVYQVWRPNP
ncbi:hypothetical protein MES5069_740036 [Mesorhizobium escarrei]|uniref:Uncharacterized protein n=1 Tax=Mesorhizobium escarrei TaxID=666018 RepID=A0ABN8KF75_9HYPH|nr:hypothetical protein MES5069_740036 [Mesorhizobium escarrei]